MQGARGFLIAGDFSWNATTLCALMLVAALAVSAALIRDEKEAAAATAELEQCRAAVTGCREVAAGRPGLCWVPGEPGVEVAP